MGSALDALLADAEDSIVSLAEASLSDLRLAVKVDSCGGAETILVFERVYHIDITPEFVLGEMKVGGAELLPSGYLTDRNIGYDGEEDDLFVAAFTDQDGNHFRIISFVKPCEISSDAT